MKYISDNLVRYRLKSGITTQTLAAELLEMKRAQINRHEAGKGGPPTIPTLLKYAEAYNCTLIDLVTDPSENPELSQISDDSSVYIPKFIVDILDDKESLLFIKKCLALSKEQCKALFKLIGVDHD